MADAEGEQPLTARERILRGARQVFAATPYERVRVEDLLRAAGVSRPTFYRLFRNKEEVFVEVSDAHAPRPRTVRERVLEGCREAFGARGYAATRVEDILTAARISRPTFYRVFASKQEAYEELDTIAVRYLLRALRHTAAQVEGWRDQLDKVLDAYLDWRTALKQPYRGQPDDREPPGLRRVRAELLRQDDQDAPLLAALLCAVDALASSWSEPPSAAALRGRKQAALRAVRGTLGR